MSKQKGKSFERKIVSLLREKLGLPKWCIFRNIASGTAEHEAGDIWINPCCFNNLHLVIECKKRKTLPTNIANSALLRDWLIQLNLEIKKYQNTFGVEPIGAIIMAANYQKPLVAIVEKGELKKIISFLEFVDFLRNFVR
jgi:hypothetical protein